MAGGPSIRPDSGKRKDSSASTDPPSAGRAPTSGVSSGRPDPPPSLIAADIARLVRERVERCFDDGTDILSVSSRDIRSELLSLGHHESEVAEPRVRRLLRRLIAQLRHP